MGLYLGGLIIGMIIAFEILGIFRWAFIYLGGLLLEFYHVNSRNGIEREEVFYLNKLLNLNIPQFF